MADRKRFDGYGRVSRRQGRTGESYISPKVQREGVDRWAEYMNVEIDGWHFDEDKSGRNQNRPGMREVIRRIEAKEVDGVVCLRLNRFARNVLGALDDIRRIKEAGGEIVFVEDQIDTNGASGQLMLTVMLAVAEWEHENFSASFREAKTHAVARGAYVSRTPWGYARNDDGTLRPHPDRAGFVTEAFRLAASDNLQAAMRYLRSVAPERRWNSTKVRRLLSQYSYLGHTRNGDLVQADTHTPLVSLRIWEAAQTTPTHRAPSKDFPLSGFARCAGCGSAMTGGRGGTGQRTYRCSSHCERSPVITAKILEDYVLNSAREALSGLRATVSDPEADVLTLLERAISDAESELDAFAGDLQLRRALSDRYHAHLQARVDALEKARSEYREQARVAQTRLALTTEDLLDPSNPQRLAVGLRSIFDSVVVSRGRGLPVDQRVALIPFDADRTSGELGGKNT